MWDGPYGEWGSRKYLIASCDQSLKRLGLDYVDIFYSHRPDPGTPMEETMGALDQIVRSGKALYAGISTYSPEETREANRILTEMGTPCLIHQPRYNMFDRWVEDGLLETLEELGIGAIAFSPLCQGILSDKYLHGIPQDSRQAKIGTLCWDDSVTASRVNKVQQLHQIAQARGQSMSQLAIAWVLRNKAITSALFGASKISHVEEAVAALDQADLSIEECTQIDDILNAE
jgi:L-glyceraldehyde 3-phosphate reductase